MFETGTPRHFLDVGLRKAEAQDFQGAQNALLHAVNSDHPEVAPEAANALGMLVADSDPSLAEEAFKVSVDSGHLRHGSRAAFALASLYQQRGNRSEALPLYEWAARSPDAEVATAAREAMRSMSDVYTEMTAEMSPAEIASAEGAHLRAAGDLEGAVSAFQRCIATRDPEFAPHAGCQLGAILTAEGDVENAKSPLWLAVRSQHPVYAPVSAFVLADILLEQRDRVTARGLLELATRHPEPEAAQRAAATLAWLQGDQAERQPGQV